MFKFFIKNKLLSIIIGALLLICSLLMIIPLGDASPLNTAWIVLSSEKNISINFIELVGGILLLVISFIVIIPNIKNQKGITNVFYILELIIFLFVSVTAFILPFITHLAGRPWHLINNDSEEAKNIGVIGFWYGLLLFVHGFIMLFSCSYTKVDKPYWFFFLGVFLLSLGVFLMVSGLGINIGQILNYIIIYGFLLLGVILVLTGVFVYIRKPTKNELVVVNDDKVEEKPEETKKEENKEEKEDKK